MAVSNWVFWFTVAYISGAFLEPGCRPVPGVILALAGLILAAFSRLGAGRILLAAGLFLLAGKGNVADSQRRLQAPERSGVYSGIAERVTREGAVMLCGADRFWLDGKSIHLDTMEGDSITALALVSGRVLRVCAHRTTADCGIFPDLRRSALCAWSRRLGPGPASSLVTALLSGDRSRLPDAIRILFRETGTTHILSVSGYHVGMVAAIAYLLMGRRIRRSPLASAAVCGLLTSAYTVFSGARPPAVRAAVMATSATFLSASGIRAPGPVLWAIAAMVVLFMDPGAMFDPGAQMSFIAVLVLIAFGWEFGFRGAKLARGMMSGFCITIALAPILTGLYGGLATASPVATVLTTPFMAATMLFGALTLLPAVWDPFARLAEWSVFLWIESLELMRLPVVEFSGGIWIWAWAASLILLWLLSERRSFPGRFG